jgi:hypothetical protein
VFVRSTIRGTRGIDVGHDRVMYFRGDMVFVVEAVFATNCGFVTGSRVESEGGAATSSLMNGELEPGIAIYSYL